MYSRLKQRKNLWKITVDEWNTAVARVQGLMTQSECGELSDDELKRMPAEL